MVKEVLDLSQQLEPAFSGFQPCFQEVLILLPTLYRLVYLDSASPFALQLAHFMQCLLRLHGASFSREDDAN